MATGAWQSLSDLRLGVVHEAISAISRATTVGGAVRELMAVLGEHMGWETGALWIAEPESGEMHCADLWHASWLDPARFRTVTLRRRMKIGHDLPGRVWETGTAIWTSEIDDERKTRLDDALRAGFHSAAAFPVNAGGKVVAVLELFSCEARPPNGELGAVIDAVCRPLGERVARERAEAERDRLMLLSHDLLCVVDAEGAVQSLNPAWERMLGHSGRDLAGRRWIELVHDADRERVIGDRFECRMTRRDGAPVWVQWTFTEVQGRPLRYGVGRDISDRKVAEENVRESEERFRAIVDGVRDYAIFMVDPEGFVVSWNSGAERILGYPTDLALGRNFSVFHAPDEMLKRKPQAELRTAEAEGRFEEEGWRLRRDGTRFWASVIVSPLRDDTGRLIGFVNVTRDITERRRAEEERASMQMQLLQGQKLQALGQLAAGIAHEINNPVGYILTNLSVTGEYFDDLEKLLRATEKAVPEPISAELAALRESIDAGFILEDFRKAIRDCNEGATRIRETVRNLKEFSHVDEGEMKPSDLKALLESAIRICWNELKYKATLEKDYGAVPAVPCYPQRIAQVFINLLVNAAQALDKKGEIRISTRTEGGCAVVCVGDTGLGIAPENLGRIFTPFFTTKRVGEGTGLGLHMAYKIVEAHGGKIEVQSKLGKGTEVIVRLPLKRTEKP